MTVILKNGIGGRFLDVLNNTQ
jgi:hypothetical protein